MNEVIEILKVRTRLHKKLKKAENAGNHAVFHKLMARLFDIDEWGGQESESVEEGEEKQEGQDQDGEEEGRSGKDTGQLELVNEKD